MPVTTSDAVKQRYKEEQRNKRMTTNGYNARYYPPETVPEQEYYYEEDRYNDRYNYSNGNYSDPYGGTTRNSRNTRRPTTPPRQVSLTQLVIDWWFCTDENGENIYIPIFTDLCYSPEFGGRNNVMPATEWESSGMRVRYDAIEYKGRVYKRGHKMINDITSWEQSCRQELLDAILKAYAPPPVLPFRKRFHWFRWMFIALFLMNLIVGYFLIRGA